MFSRLLFRGSEVDRESWGRVQLGEEIQARSSNVSKPELMMMHSPTSYCASDTLEASSGDVSAAGESNASDNIPEVEKAGVAKAEDQVSFGG